MNYRTDKYGNSLSALGYGCMRFPKKAGKIHMAETEKLIRHAVESGINYFDTAYIYPGSEAAVGEILEKTGLRSRVNIATKLPHYLIRNREGLDKLFNEELRRLRTDHVDYYLMHMLNDLDTWERLKALGIEEWIAEKRLPVPSGRWVFPITATVRPSAVFWMPMTGSSARSSTITWTNTPRPAAGAFSTPTAKASPSSSWNPSGAADW